MAFRLKNDKIKSTVIRLEVYIPGETSRFKYNTGRSIKPEHLDQKKYRPKTMRGSQGDRNRKLNLIMNEYEFAVERIREVF